MIDFPKLAILILTYQRTEYALRTIKALSRNLDYDKSLLGWYIADDGSEPEHVETLLSELEKRKEHVIGYHNQRFSPNTGIGWNKGLGICYQFSDFVMVLEDDWVLSGNFDMNPNNHPGKYNISPYLSKGKMNVRPWIEMLAQREDVGMLRMGGLAVGNSVEIVGYQGHHYLKYSKEQQYAYSGNPQIRHARFINAYGWYSETELNPGELELNYDARFRSTPGPDIWRPSDIPGWGLFHHIGEMNYHNA